MAVGFTILYAQLPTFGRLLGNDQFKLLDVDPLLTAGVLFIGLILAVTSIQMTLLKFRPAI